jgi:hypothetical protein
LFFVRAGNTIDNFALWDAFIRFFVFCFRHSTMCSSLCLFIVHCIFTTVFFFWAQTWSTYCQFRNDWPKR